MVTGKEFIKQILHMNNAPYFRISKGENGAIIYQNDLDGTKSINDGLNDLDQVLSVLSPGNYHMKYFREKTQGSKFMGVAFAIGSENNNNAQIQGFQQQPQIDVTAEIEKAINGYKTEVELKTLKARVLELEKENKELEKQVNDRTMGIISGVTPYLAPHVARMINGFIPIPNNENSSTAKETVTGSEEEIKEQLIAAFNNWDEDPATAINLLNGIANLQKNNPTMYETAKQFILNN